VRHIERRGTLVRDSDSNVVRRLGINLDITDQVKKEQALRDAVSAALAASKAKAEFLATMSHEIRTPLNGVIGMTGLLLTTALDTTQREYTEVIRSSGEGLLSLINDILDFSKIEAGKLELETLVFSLDQVARDVVTLFREQAAGKGLELLSELPEAGTLVKGDCTRLRQILLNLTSNALKFTQQGSVRVCVRAAATLGPELPVEIEITDTGIGMSPRTLAQLGEPFTQADSSTTRQFGGTGLGLSICKSLVQLMNGSWQVNSELGKGSSFLLRLPLQHADAGVPERGSLPAPQRAELEAVLVADDNVVNQRVVSLMLKKHAKRVDLANDGREALEMFKAGTYDLVFMDGQMPNLDGLEATRLIRAHEARTGALRTPIIALTANALPGDRETFLAAGMDYYLTKPVRPKDLERALLALENERR
jgi:signal transduction histidine kinase/CheY-like chemotaxis protein